MMQLLTFPPAFGLFASSPFCVKAAYLLTMSGQKWERKDIFDPRKMPHGKLPVLQVDNQLIADSDRIQSFLESKGADFSVGMSELDCANARAFIRMAEEHLYFCLVLDRWGNDSLWPAVRDTYFGTMPAGIRHIVAAGIRKNTLKGLHHQGLGRLSDAQRLERIKPDLAAMATRLKHGKFLFGDAPTAADASIAPILAAAMVSPGETLLKSYITQQKQFVEYVHRVDTACS